MYITFLQQSYHSLIVGKRFSIYPCPSTCTFSLITAPYQRVCLLKLVNPTFIHHNHPESLFYTNKVHSSCCTFYRFVHVYKCIQAYVCHYDSVQSIFTALKIHCALSIHLLPSPPANLWQSLIFLSSLGFCLFQDVLQLESYSM